MAKDRIVLGATIGILADAVKLAVNYALFRLGFTSVVFWRIVATRFVLEQYLDQPITLLIGAVADITVTAAFGVIFLYLIEYTGKEYIWIKGIGFALLIWVGVFGTLLGQVVQQSLPQNPSGIIVTIVAHFFFGLALAFFGKLLIRNEE